LDSNNQVTQVTLSLPGGAVLHVAGGEKKWSYPNLQGSIVAQADDTGARTGGPFVYDPDGIPVHGGLPDTRPGDMDDTWLGGHARPLEHAAGLQPVIEMGARQYHPVLARFLEVDPLEGGVLNDYGYVPDPTNDTDLSGHGKFSFCAAPWHWDVCWVAEDVYWSSTSYARERATARQWTTGRENAFRHAVAIGQLAWKYGYDDAVGLGDHYEVNDDRDARADRRNNRYGAGLAVRMRGQGHNFWQFVNELERRVHYSICDRGLGCLDMGGGFGVHGSYKPFK
jgi:RHS repeat-associated protein